MFRTYLSSTGANQVQKAINQLSSAAREAMKSEFRHLAVSPRAEWRRPRAAQLKGYENLVEIIFKADKVQWRAVGFHGPSALQFTITALCTHKANVYAPQDALDTAARRKREVQSGQASTASLQVDGEDYPPLPE